MVEKQKPKILNWLKRYDRRFNKNKYKLFYNYSTNKVEIDVDRNVDLNDQKLIKFPDYIRFNEVDGWFDCSGNQLTSLEGCPREVRGGFYCSGNQLTSLEGCPREVDGDFHCSNNPNLTYIDIEYLETNCKIGGKIYFK